MDEKAIDVCAWRPDRGWNMVDLAGDGQFGWRRSKLIPPQMAKSYRKIPLGYDETSKTADDGGGVGGEFPRWTTFAR